MLGKNLQNIHPNWLDYARRCLLRCGEFTVQYGWNHNLTPHRRMVLEQSFNAKWYMIFTKLLEFYKYIKFYWSYVLIYSTLFTSKNWPPVTCINELKDVCSIALTVTMGHLIVANPPPKKGQTCKVGLSLNVDDISGLINLNLGALDAFFSWVWCLENAA